jgi:Fic family protein
MNSEERHLAEIIPYIALDRSLEKTRPEYYLVLQKCSGGIFDANPTVYDYMFLLNYMIKRIEESLPNINFYVSKYEKFKSLTETDHKILQAFRGKPEKYMQTKDLVKYLEIPRRTIIYSINKLLSAEFIQSTGISAGKKYKIAF